MGKEIISRTTLAKGVTACVVVAASLGVIKIGDYAVDSSETTTATSSVTAGAASYTPGTYTAASAGISSDVTVTCTFDENSITAIEVDVSGETADIGAAIGDEMIEQFMAAQGSAVDGVSGATITSDALKAALEDCIAQATGGSSDDGEAASAEEESEESESDVSAEADEADEAETEADEMSEAETEAIEEAEAADTEAGTVEEADTDESAREDSQSTASGGSFTPGTYTATAAGMESDVTVTITVDENSILSVSCDVSGETEGVGAAIGSEISTQILDAQSADVDGVSGATVTSEAVKEAAADALSQAAGSQADTSEEDTDETEADTEAADTEAIEAETEAASVDAESESPETEIVTESSMAEEEDTESGAETEMEVVEAETESAEDASETAEAGAGIYTPGTYTSSAAGISSDVTVTIIVDEDSILSVGCDVSGETDGIGADIGPEISGQILTAQSADVDGVSGATVTSDAVKAAIADCIAQAKAGTSVDSDESASETEDADAAEPAEEAEAETEEPETELTATEEIESEYVTEAESDSSKSGVLYTAGTYTSAAEGYSADITVTMTFDETSILEMDVDTSGETSTYALIDEDVIAQILEAQSTDIDGISGATVTTDAILEAAADCIAQAQSDSTAAVIGSADGATAIFIAGQEDETESEEEAVEAESEDVSAAYVPGTYSASAEGISSTITVSVSFNENRMYRIDYDLSGETEDIGAAIGPELTSRILDAQSAEVDGVSGATITSDAVKSAVADCITQALSDAE